MTMCWKSTLVLGVALALSMAACEQHGESAPTATSSAEAKKVPKQEQPPSDVAAAPSSATKLDSGVAFTVLNKGRGGSSPKINDAVRVKYVFWNTKGTPLASSFSAGRPARVSVKGLMPGVAQVVQKMKVGEKRRVWIPAKLTKKGWPRVDSSGDLTAEIELLQIFEGPRDIPTPKDVAAPPKDAKKTASGLHWKVIAKGTGKIHPNKSDKVKVHYSGWTTDGNMFDSSERRNKPAVFPLDQVIAGWTEGLQLMTEGEKCRFWIPEKLAYKGMPGKPAGMLVFDVTLLKILRPPPTPKDVARPPKSAEKTKSGLASKVLAKGTGTEHPKATSRVKVEYSGWTTDGKSFDYSRKRHAPAAFGVGGVIPGWTEGLQLMVKGETRRFWIPANLAYGENPRPGAPRGMLVFDVQLIDFR